MESRMDLIDFTDCPQTKKAYSGTALMKYSVQYNGDLYMLKFSGRSKENQPQFYTGNVLSEYIGSHILNIVRALRGFSEALLRLSQGLQGSGASTCPAVPSILTCQGSLS